MNTSKPRRITNTRGWRTRTVLVNHVAEAVFIAPDGVEYIRARNGERPDATIIPRTPGLAPMPIRRFDTSSAYRNITSVKLALAMAARKRKATT